MRQEAKEYSSFPLGNRLYIRLVREGNLFIRRARKKKITGSVKLREAEQTPRRL